MPCNRTTADGYTVSQHDPLKIPQTTVNDSSGTAIRSRRLGILQLGLHAHEKSAPFKSLQLMTTDAAVRISNIVPVMATACQQDLSIGSAYLCHPNVQYITKHKSEGSFCGYRNTQMMISYVLGSHNTADNTAVETFIDGIPSIMQIQDLIERAWDMGINKEGRIETGGIVGSRKHIGTSEVQALFKSLGISCKANRFVRNPSGADRRNDACGSRSAFCSLLDYAEDHFKARSAALPENKVHITAASPIYLQRPHHSLTIIGIEFGINGQRNLLVLDPKSRPSPTLLRATDAFAEGAMVDVCVSLKGFRRGRWDLGLYRQFETLSLIP